MLDIHSHIIPSIDDGARNIEIAIEMLKIAQKSGTSKIVATPHYYRGFYENEYKNIKCKVEKLSEVAKKEDINIEILVGQEVFIDRHTLEDYEHNLIGGLNGTGYMLVEFPLNTFPGYILDTIYELQLKEIKPIIAHPERYKYVIEKPSFINELIEEKCYFQINAPSLLGYEGKKVKNTAEVLISSGACHFIGSDAHGINKRRPIVSEAFKLLEKKNKSLSENIIQNNELMLLDRHIEYSSQKINENKNIFSFLKK